MPTVQDNPALFGYEAIVSALRGEHVGKFGLSIRLSIIRGPEQLIEKVVPIPEVFGSEHSAEVYAKNWIAQKSIGFLEE